MKKTKTIQRRLAYKARNAQQNKTSVSSIICDTIIELPIYQQAKTVMWYCHCRSEVRTLYAMVDQLVTDKRIVIPYCKLDENRIKQLGLWLLEDIDEMQPGTWNILEPPETRWGEVDKQISVEQLDVIIVPGVGFDKNGGRLGNGAGYYDRLLHTLKPHTVTIGIGFETQLVEQIVMHEHDIFLDMVITEQAIYKGKGRQYV